MSAPFTTIKVDEDTLSLLLDGLEATTSPYDLPVEVQRREAIRERLTDALKRVQFKTQEVAAA